MWGVKRWICCFLFGLISTAAKISEKNLRKILTPAEWLLLMGNTKAADYDIIHLPPIQDLPSRNTAKKDLVLKTSHFGKTFTLTLSLVSNLLSSDFVILETFNNESKIIPYAKSELLCYYRSKKAAISFCDGIRGIAHVDTKNYYIIHPLPKRFHNETSSPHILIRKSHNIINLQTLTSDKTNRYRNQYYKRKKKKRKVQNVERSNNQEQSLPKNSMNDSLNITVIKTARRKREIEGPIFVETAIFVDRDLFDHMATNFPVETERELIRFVLAMINAVQLLYHDSSLGRQVNFVLKRLEVLKNEPASLTRSPDIDRFLSSFCNWQRTINPVGDREPQHWDHALILTGLDLYVRNKHGKVSNQVVGLAPVAGMCTSTSSCTVNEGRHFESVYVVAHEIGHNLGMRHDGPLADNDCDPSSYIMSPTLGSGKITWSSCSRKYLQQFLETPQSRCLLDHSISSGSLDHSAEGALPGERFNADQQCMLKYGKGSRHSSQQPLDDVCRDLHCERERYTWTSHPALEGTTCGYNMWCRGGKCISKGSPSNAAYVMSSTTTIQKVNGGWSPWKSFSECASGCLYGEEGRLRTGSTGIMISTRTCTNPRPQGNGEQCEGPAKKYQACNANQCLNVPRLTVREFADQICGRAKDVDKDLTGTGFQRLSSDPEEACSVWCQKRNGGSKSRGWTFPDGTVCHTRRTRFAKPSYCINGICEEFGCDSYKESTFAQMSDLCPIDKKDNNIIYNVGLRQRDSRFHWSSASGCHFNCISSGSGIRLVISYRGKKTRSSIQLCKADEGSCSRVKTPYQYASIVCGKYKDRVRRLSGFGMQISAALEDPDRPCRVACQDENITHRFYLVNGEDGWFPFGTDCSKGLMNKKAYCISGKCLEFGQDGTPVSESEFTLPLHSRIRRSLFNNGSTVIATLNESDLEEIIHSLNKTLLGKIYNENEMELKKSSIDFDNPIHVDMEEKNLYLKLTKNNNVLYT